MAIQNAFAPFTYPQPGEIGNQFVPSVLDGENYGWQNRQERPQIDWLTKGAMAPVADTNTYQDYSALPPAPSPISDANYYDAGASTASDIGSGLGWISKFSAMAPGIGTVVSAVTGVGSLIANWWSAKEQRKASEKAQAQAQANWEKQQAESTRRFDIGTKLKQAEMGQAATEFGSQMGLANRKETHSEKMDEANLALTKEKLGWDKYLMLMNNMMQMFSTPSSRSNIANLYQARK